MVRLLLERGASVNVEDWEGATPLHDEQSLTIYATYLSGALGGLPEAALSLLRSPLGDVAICSWQNEPGEYRWLFRLTQQDVQVEILRFDDTFSSLPNERGELVFKAECSLLRLATQVKRTITSTAQ